MDGDGWSRKVKPHSSLECYTPFFQNHFLKDFPGVHRQPNNLQPCKPNTCRLQEGQGRKGRSEQGGRRPRPYGVAEGFLMFFDVFDHFCVGLCKIRLQNISLDSYSKGVL